MLLLMKICLKTKSVLFFNTESIVDFNQTIFMYSKDTLINN